MSETLGVGDEFWWATGSGAATGIASSVGFLIGGPAMGGLLAGLAGGGLAMGLALRSGQSWSEALVAGGRAAVVDGVLGVVPGGLIGGATRGIVKGGARNMLLSTRLAFAPSGGLRAARAALPRRGAGSLVTLAAVQTGHTALSVYDLEYEAIPVVNIGNAAQSGSHPGMQDLWMPNQHAHLYPDMYRFSDAVEQSYRSMPLAFRQIFDTFGAAVKPPAPALQLSPGFMFPEPKAYAEVYRAYGDQEAALIAAVNKLMATSKQILLLLAESAESSGKAKDAVNAIVDTMSASARTIPSGTTEELHILRFMTTAVDAGERLLADIGREQQRIADDINRQTKQLQPPTQPRPEPQPSKAVAKRSGSAGRSQPPEKPPAKDTPRAGAPGRQGKSAPKGSAPHESPDCPGPPARTPWSDSGGTSPHPAHPPAPAPPVGRPVQAMPLPPLPQPEPPDLSTPQAPDPGLSGPSGLPAPAMPAAIAPMLGQLAAMAQAAAMQSLYGDGMEALRGDDRNKDERSRRDTESGKPGPSGSHPPPGAAPPNRATVSQAPEGAKNYTFPDGRSQPVSASVEQALRAAFDNHAATDAKAAYAGTRSAWAGPRPGTAVTADRLRTGDVALWSSRSAILVVFGDGEHRTEQVVANGALRQFAAEMSDNAGKFGAFLGYARPTDIVADAPPVPSGEPHPTLHGVA
ncbi:MAG: hypothetical protein HOQ24_11480 [Mycobacteriaceae bacterium]|nr:hypothetical protein [Mycobacteriaceae bacterium]